MLNDHIVPAENLDQISSLLAETQWADTLSPELLSRRDSLYDLLNLPKPAPKATPAQRQEPASNKEEQADDYERQLCTVTDAD